MIDMKSYLLGWLLALMVVGCIAETMRYSDIEMLGVQTCPLKDSCNLIRPGNFSDRNCECDSNCATYNDCCIDAPARRPTSVTRDVCMPFGDLHLGAYVVATCPEGSDPTLVNLCRRDDHRDPFLSTPVTDEVARRTYLNRYCAQCNKAAPNLQSWILELECPVNFTWSNVTRNSRGWSVHGRSCKLMFDRPPRLRGGPRLCRANLTDTCPQHSARRTYSRACGAYLAVVVDENLVAYRNPHCALCNGKTVDDLLCFSPTIFTRGRKPFSFALLLDVNQSNGNRVGVDMACPEGEKYDPFFKKCRPLVCSIPGYTMSNGKCVKN